MLLGLHWPAGQAEAAGINTLVAEDEAAITLGSRLVYWRDSGESLDARTILDAPGAIDWQPTESAVPNLGLAEEPVWFALRLTSPAHTRRLLSIGYPPLDRVDFFVASQGRWVSRVATGDQRPFASRPVAHRDFVFPLELEPEQDYLILIRVQTEGALQLPAELWEPNAYLAQSQVSLGAQSLFAGIMLALAIYNLLLYFVVRDRAYLWYVLYLGTYLVGQLALRGLGFQYLWPGAPAFNSFMLPASLALGLASFLLFSLHFLHMNRQHRFWSLATRGLAWGAFLLAGLTPLASYHLAIVLLILLVTAGALLVAGAGFWFLWRGEIMARFYLLALSLFLVGTILFNLNKAGVLPSSYLFEYSAQIGAVLQMLLLSFALAYRIRLERRARQKAQAETLKVQREANEQLEARVAERTRELHQAYEKLKLVSELDGLTQLKNRPFFDQALEREWRRNTREVRDISLLMLDVDHFKQVNDTLGHQCGDACLRHLAALCRSHVGRASDVVARYGGEEFVILLPCTDLPGAALVAERIRQAVLEAEFTWQGERLPLSLSVGVASCIPSRHLGYESLVRHADQALYRSKTEGRNRTTIAQGEDDKELAFSSAGEYLHTLGKPDAGG